MKEMKEPQLKLALSIMMIIVLISIYFYNSGERRLTRYEKVSIPKVEAAYELPEGVTKSPLTIDDINFFTDVSYIDSKKNILRTVIAFDTVMQTVFVEDLPLQRGRFIPLEHSISYEELLSSYNREFGDTLPKKREIQ